MSEHPEGVFLPESYSRPIRILIASCYGPAFNNNRFNGNEMPETPKRKNWYS